MNRAPRAFFVPPEWKGQTAVIFGGGPSLKSADVEYARARGWRRIACNDAFRLDLEADVLCFGDMRWFIWNRKEIATHRGTYKITWRPIPWPPYEVKLLGMRKSPPSISLDPGRVVANNTGQGAINLAFLFGASRIVLLGFDMRMVGKRHNWHKYHQKGTSPTRYKDVFIPAITAAAKTLAEHKVEVLNATPDSALKVFPFVPLREIR